ncbi:MAG: Tfp pilus assembly protein PilF [Shackletoniella antarctica]|uniref:Tfp pilus assembly protein PilF n=1 Tax=Shackletoniella antarctica TaxID=268115 RepID=A0A2W4WK65_9CYAN|nr:MAG: Tfp pilus assembly protein PilF [Shackletoniella antarctica]
MPTITLCEQRQLAPNQFQATLQFEGGGSYPVTITNPFNEQQEAQLEWYFEGWLRRPFLDRVTADQIRDSIPTYGKTLFDQVFADRKAYAAYTNLRPQISTVEFVIESASPEFQALHWEALQDPDLPRPLALDCTMVRRPQQAMVVAATPNPSPTINLLVVTARPGEEKDVNYRTISRPLIEAIQQARVPINVELLRPGTYRALENHLQAKGAGYYHIVHFDAHGGLATFEQIANEQQESDAILFKDRYGRSDVEPYAGVKAFLFLEGETPGQSDPVEAQELAHLLTNQGIPVCILNACQSAKQVRQNLDVGSQKSEDGGDDLQLQTLNSNIQNPETSLGSRLMTAGMQMVVAMGYSVSVTAATILMEKLYAELFTQKPLAEAIRLGRRELHNRKTRKGWFNMTVELEDWLLPVVYGSSAVRFDLQEMSARDKATYYQAKASRYRFTQPTYGFVGRDLEILKIEKSLLRRNVLLLRGMGGTGKTTLLSYLREWWQTTQFAKDVFYFGYDERAYTLEQIIQNVGQRVYDEFEWSSVQPLSLAAKAEMLAETLRSEPYGLMLDNLESVTGQDLAIQNTLPKAEQTKLKDFLQKLVGGKTRVVLGSRSSEDWLAQVYRDNRYALQGLDPQSRTELAEKILEKHVGSNPRIEQLRQDKDFGRLMTLLAGYPLAMEVVLANLARQSPTEILAALDAADVNLDSGSDDKTQSILKCVEYSHSNLSPQAQKLLLCLAPFKGVFVQLVSSSYIQELQKLEPFQGYDFSQFENAIQDAINWGLLSPHDAGLSGILTIQPIFPYFLKTKLAELDEATRDALETGFKNHYQDLAGQYQQLMNSKDPQERQLGLSFTRLEYDNLYAALQIGLKFFAKGVLSIYGCLDEFLKLNQDKQTKIQLARDVYVAIDKYPEEQRDQEVELSLLALLDGIALGYYQSQNYEAAQKYYQITIQIINKLEDVPDELKGSLQASTYHQMGSVAQAQRHYEQAQQYYQQALDLKIELGDRYAQARTYHQMGSVAQEQRHYEQAQQYYQQALDLNIEFGDRYEQARTYHQIGSVAQAQRHYEQAQQYYQQALDLFIEFGDRYGQASTYYQLGQVAEETGDAENARAYYIEDLRITVEFNDEHGLGISLRNLARFYQTTQNEALLTEAAQILNTTSDELRQAFEQNQP